MRQLADKANRIDQQEFAAAWQLHGANDRIKRSKQFILCKHICIAQCIEQCGFPCIGISNKRNNRDLVFFTSGAAQAALFLQLLDLPTPIKRKCRP